MINRGNFMFIGRKKELQFLKERYEDKKAQLIVLYGRRRIGKTETLKEFCKDKPHVFYSCTQSTDKIQLSKFSRQLLKENIPAKRYISEFNDWESAFSSIDDLPYGDRKKLIVIDEFPYMCKGNSSIPSILQNLWDNKFKDSNIMIILCGSSMSFIEKELLAEKNPLYGRATGIYKMDEMNFYDVSKFFPDYSDKDKILTYAILGGIPHYLSQFDPEISLADNIKRNILSKGCVLYSETEFLLHQELRETPVYNSIIETVALGNTKLNEISQKSLIDSTSKTSVYLKNLIELGIIERVFSIDNSSKERVKANRGTYRLRDNFFRFWYTFGFANISALEDGDIDGVYDNLISPQLHEFASLPFEDVCMDFLKELQKNNLLPFRFSKIGNWSGKTTIRDNTAKNGLRTAETEIDILAVNKDSSKYLIGECKFKNSPCSYSEYLDTLAKLTPLKSEAEFYYALFSESGFDEKIIREAENSDWLYLYNLETIVNYKGL